MTVRFGDITTNEPVHAMLDGNGTVHMAYWNTVDDDVVMLRLYPDADRDLVFDLIDAMPSVGDQWKNTDGDNYGDNPLGPLPDACPTDAGTSSFIFQGCDDYDTDGFRDDIDGCDDVGGTSWIDRFGCEDRDQDGWSDNLLGYIDGDQFYSNWKQALTPTMTGLGTITAWIVAPRNSTPMPTAGTSSLTLHHNTRIQTVMATVITTPIPFTAITVPLLYGESYRDRNGCLDSDGDGASDPSDEGTFFEWNISQGADVWPFDPTQWKDTDGDGYGDNASENATNPDFFPLRKAAANDTDDDGYADNWTALLQRLQRRGHPNRCLPNRMGQLKPPKPVGSCLWLPGR